VDDAAAELAKELCHALGGGTIRPLAESLAAEERGRAFRRLTDILVSFGSRGRDAVEQLKQSANPAVRRTAIHLLSKFGGNDALTELAPLVEDKEPNVQREAIRAIVNIGSEEAFAVLERALAGGDQHSREAITAALVSIRDERAIPLFSHIRQDARVSPHAADRVRNGDRGARDAWRPRVGGSAEDGAVRWRVVGAVPNLGDPIDGGRGAGRDADA
jgi:HEAT repeat protein